MPPHRVLAAQRKVAAVARRLPRIIEQNYVNDLEDADDDPEKIKQAYRRMYIAVIVYFHVTPPVDITRLEEAQVELVQAANSPVELIARDQALKFAAMVNRALLSPMSPDYRWITCRDERVRPFHRALDGQVFSWNDPPITNAQGERNAPGEDIQCRCVPILP